MPDVDYLLELLRDFVDKAAGFDPGQVEHESFKEFSAYASAAKLANALDKALSI